MQIRQSFPKLHNTSPNFAERSAPRIVRHFTPMKTVVYEFMTQRDGTVRRLH